MRARKSILRADGLASALRETEAATAFTSRVEPEITGHATQLPEGEFAFGRVGDTEIAVALPQVDAAVERTRIEKELAESSAHASRLEKQLSNETFRSKAPPHVIAGMETTLAETRSKLEGLNARLAAL